MVSLGSAEKRDLARRLLFNVARAGSAHGAIVMQRSESTVRASRSVGMVHRVDTINRELTVFVHDDVLTFDVPVGCPIVLHGERVRLRMVQPRDRVNVTYTPRGGLLIALALEVQPIGPLPDSPWENAN